MYAVIKTGGKQYKVAPAQFLKVEKLDAAEPGAQVEFDQVLLYANDNNDITVGAPLVKNCTVTAVVIRNDRARKVKIIKFKRRKHHMKQMGHRQSFTEVKIQEIKQG